MESMRINLVQARLHWQDPDRNRQALAMMMRGAAPADLHVLPETFTTGFLGESDQAEEGMDGATVHWLRAQAKELESAVCGSAVIHDAAGRRNRLLYVTADGQVHHYDKRHLFSYAGEDQRYVAGEERVVFEHAGWRICPQICYDLRFPVWCRNQNDYDLLLFVANWPAPRVAAWDVLLRARAIENQCYVIGLNRVGEDGNQVDYPGHSVIYDPLGDALAGPETEAGVFSATISLEGLRAVRARFPFSAEADDFNLP